MLNTIFPKIHKEGYKFLAISIIVTFLVLFFSQTLGLILILITIWVYYFFRDPERYSINDDDFLVSPADGLITHISEQAGPMELQLENESIIRQRQKCSPRAQNSNTQIALAECLQEFCAKSPKFKQHPSKKRK